MKNKIKKPYEVYIEEAIHKHKARMAKRDRLLQKDDVELVDIQIYHTDLRGTHPTGQDVNISRRKKWLRNFQTDTSSTARFSKLMLWVAGIYLGIHLIVALIRFIYKI